MNLISRHGQLLVLLSNRFLISSLDFLPDFSPPPGDIMGDDSVIGSILNE